ncbi:hypothetical protein BGW39_002126, partial [Mortierella sp. 14UC]
ACFESTAQLALCSHLLRRHFATSMSTTTTATATTAFATTVAAATIKPLDPGELDLIQPFIDDHEMRDYIFWMTQKVVEVFVNENLRSKETLAEVLRFGPCLDESSYRKLLNCLIAEFQGMALLDTELLQAMVQMVECAGPGYLVADDLVKILDVLRTHLQDTRKQSFDHTYHAAQALSRLLDMMVEGNVHEVSRVKQYEPLAALLRQLAESPDVYLKHQATYALQGLLHIPSDGNRLGLVLRHASNIAMNVSKVASMFKLDFGGLNEGVEQLFKTLVDVQEATTEAFSGMQSLLASGRDIMASVKGGSFSDGRQPWYPALRKAQEHIRSGRLADFNRLVFEAPCCRDMEFQWGICQLLDDIATDPFWDVVTRQHAVDFLATLYRDASIRKQDEGLYRRILDPFSQTANSSDPLISARSQLQDLECVGSVDKQGLYSNVLTCPLHPYIPKTRLSDLPSSLLDRVQAVTEVDRGLHKVIATRLKGLDNTLYIPPLAKPSKGTADDILFPLMENALEFLASPRKVLLLLGDSGAGKSTFILQLERTLWQTYGNRDDPIPLHVNLPAINDPHNDMIPKRLRQLNFTDEQIMELKKNEQQFIFICDGYDESQLEKNLYTFNQFNQPGQWKVKLVITCRMQYLGLDYRYRFQPNVYWLNQPQGEEVNSFQEAFIAPFSRDQIKAFVDQYVRWDLQKTIAPDQPKWSTTDYMDKLENIDGLMEFVSNPFLLTFAMRVLPKAIKLEDNMTDFRLTRAQLYNVFIKQWLENSMNKLQESPLAPVAQAAFEKLRVAHFVQEGTTYQMKLAAAIFEHQKGAPVVSYVD